MGILIAAVAGALLFVVRSSQKKQSAAQAISGAMKQKAVLQKQYQKYNLSQASAQASDAAQSAIPPVPEARSGWKQRFAGLFGFQSGKMAQSFKQSLKLLRLKISGRDFRYKVPWFVMIGESGAGKTTILNNSGLAQPFGRVGDDPFVFRNPCTWWLYTNGVILDVDGAMVLSSDGHTSDDATWRSFLALLRRNRPERPVDGFVVAISAADLIGPTKLSPENLRRKAEYLYQKIWSAQKNLGMTFPIYVFVTKCDRITGFRSYVSELPQNLQDDMFGWSNPYSVHAAFVPSWVDEAFKNLNNTIYKTQIEIFAESEVVEDSDGVFLFPSEFQNLQEPLRVYLNHLFKESAYHESFMFRGVYFTGDAKLDAPVSTEMGGAYTTSGGEAASPVFVKHTFEKKIFPEFRLARPVFRSLLARNRWAVAGQIACLAVLLIGGIALWLSRNSLIRDTDAFRPILTQVEQNLAQIRDVENSEGRRLTSTELLQRLQGVDPTKVLNGMQSINSATLQSLFLPASWLSDLDDRMDTVLLLTFNRIVLGSIYLNLSQRTQEALEMQSPPPTTDDPLRALNVAGMPEFQTWRRFVERSSEIGEYTNMYNFEAMPNSGDLPTLGKLVKYIYGVELPPNFYENSDFYFRALKRSQQEVIDVDALRRQFRAKNGVFAQQFFDSLIERRLPRTQLDMLQMQLDELAMEPTTADSDPEPYRGLMASIDSLNQVLQRPEMAWLGKERFDPGPEYGQLMELIDKSPLLGSDARTQMEDMSVANFSVMQRTLRDYQSSLTGPLLQLSEGIYKPAAPIMALRQGLEDFLNQRFMATAVSRRLRTVPPQGSEFTWDSTGLQQALQLVEPYNAYIAAGLNTFRPALQNRLRVLALNRLEANMMSLVSAAEKTQTSILQSTSLEQDVQAETKQLSDVTKPLSDLLTAFQRLGFSQSYNDLSDAVQSSAFIHLRAVDLLFNQKSPYAYNEKGLSIWDGTAPLITVAFAVKDEKGLVPYLEAQRDSLKRMREYIQPALAIISSLRSQRRNAADTQVLAKWQDLVVEVDKYDNKNPSSTLAALEAFIGATLPTVTLENYPEKLAGLTGARVENDFFSETQNDLADLIYGRLEVIASNRVVRQYRELEAFFNLNLASKFPFSVSIAGEQADPGAIRDFFKLLDASAPNITRYYERNTGRFPTPTRVVEFIDSMMAVREVFATFLNDPKAMVPVFDFEVDFRVNRSRESGGNNVIEWALQVADQTITAGDTQRRGRWVLGNPVRLSLRWAKDGTIAPALASSAGVVVQDRTVTFEDLTRWSMFRMLKAQASTPADFDQLADPMPNTLKFVIPTMQTTTGITTQTRVFVRVTLLTDKQAPISLPIFPERAPSIATNVGP